MASWFRRYTQPTCPCLRRECALALTRIAPALTVRVHTILWACEGFPGSAQGAGTLRTGGGQQGSEQELAGCCGSGGAPLPSGAGSWVPEPQATVAYASVPDSAREAVMTRVLAS